MKLRKLFQGQSIRKALMIILPCLISLNGIAHDDNGDIFKNLKQNASHLKLELDELCLQEGKSRYCHVENQKMNINFELLTIPFRELCDLAGNPLGCDNASEFDDQYKPGSTWSNSTCSKTTCYCSDPTIFDVDCTMMMVNHCGLVSPTEKPGSGGVKSCPCVHDCG